MTTLTEVNLNPELDISQLYKHDLLLRILIWFHWLMGMIGLIYSIAVIIWSLNTLVAYLEYRQCITVVQTKDMGTLIIDRGGYSLRYLRCNF